MQVLKALRNEKRISQAELAKALNVAQNTVANWENGVREPDNATIAKIANYFGVSTDYLLGLSDNPTPAPRTDIDLSEIDYALFGETKHLNESEKQELLRLAKFFREQKAQKQK